MSDRYFKVNFPPVGDGTQDGIEEAYDLWLALEQGKRDGFLKEVELCRHGHIKGHDYIAAGPQWCMGPEVKSDDSRCPANHWEPGLGPCICKGRVHKGVKSDD